MAEYTVIVVYEGEKGTRGSETRPLELPFDTEDEANEVFKQITEGKSQPITVKTADGQVMLSTRNLKIVQVKHTPPQEPFVV